MKRGDVVGGLLFFGMLLAIFGIAFFAKPAAAPVTFAPVDLPGSSLTFKTSAADPVLDVTLVKPGFVTAHEAMGIAPGQLLATSSVLQPGQQEVSLLLGGFDGPVVYLLFADDGDGVFEPGVDLPVMANGQSVRLDYAVSGN